MKTQKIKRYRLGISRTFPATHPKAGELTFFKQKILLALMRQKNPQLKINAQDANGVELEPKFHTCRANLKLWEDRIAEVLAGRAVIELFDWEDKPYRSKQIVFATLDKDSGCGVQKLLLNDFYIEELCNECGGEGKTMKAKLYPTGHTEVTETCCYCEDGISYIKIHENTIAKNDGLSLQDFKDWFNGYDLSEPMAIIHFTKFRY